MVVLNSGEWEMQWEPHGSIRVLRTQWPPDSDSPRTVASRKPWSVHGEVALTAWTVLSFSLSLSLFGRNYLIQDASLFCVSCVLIA